MAVIMRVGCRRGRDAMRESSEVSREKPDGMSHANWGKQFETTDKGYAPAELEFMFAMDRYKRDHRKPFPTWSEVLSVITSLGYTKGAQRGQVA